MSTSRIASFAMLASGVAGVLMPERVASALALTPGGSRGRAEAAVGLGGTYAALGAWGFVRGGPAETAVGITWLGAAATRVATLRNRPDTDWTFWAYLALET